MRIDSDYVAQTNGPYDIQKLREKILTTKRELHPRCLGITHVNLFPDYYHTGPPKERREGYYPPGIDPPVSSLAARIIQWFPGLKFVRKGRWEGIRWQDRLKYSIIEEPYWFHCNFKSKVNQLVRFYRNNWRELGDFKKYPRREDYIKEVIQEEYGTQDMHVAAEYHWEKNVKPYLIKYSETDYYPYPELIKQEIK